MEIFIATSIKSFDLNPTHPGPLPRASFHTSANQQIERSESKAARGRARRATNEVGDRLQKSASSEQDELTKAGDMLQGQRVVAIFCASRSSLNGSAMISSSRLAELQHVPPAWKFCAAQSQERFDRENAQRADRRKWKTTARPRKTLPGSPDQGHEKNKRGRNRAGATRKDQEEVEVFRGSLHGVARVLQAAQPGGCLRRWGPRPAANTWVVVLEGHERAINPNLDSSSKTDLETRGKDREWKRKLSDADSAKRAPGRNRARDHPLQRRTQDHRATSPAAGPWRAHGSAAAKRAGPRKRANLARGKICDFGPEL